MKNVLDSKTDQPSEHLGVTSIEGMMLAIVRQVNNSWYRFLLKRMS